MPHDWPDVPTGPDIILALNAYSENGLTLSLSPQCQKALLAFVTADPVRDAAPDMLAALKLLMGMYNDQSREEISHGVAPVEPLWVGTVRDAIAKAEAK